MVGKEETAQHERAVCTCPVHAGNGRQAQIQLFENAFRHAPIGMAVVGLDGKLLKLNQVFCDVIGYSQDEATALRFQDITHPDDLPADVQLVERVLAGEIDRYQMEKRYIRKSGRPVWVNLSVSLVRRSDGSPRHFISQVQDLTGVREVQSRYRLIAEHASDIIATSGLNGLLNFITPACETITGYSPAELLGRGGPSFTTAEHAAELHRVFRGLLGGRPSEQVLWQIKHKTEPRMIWLESNPSLLRDEQTGEPIGFLDVVRDVTKQKAQKDELARARAEAERAMQTNAKFLANISHELRTPLNSVIGFSRLLAQSKGLTPEDQHRVNLVYEAGQVLHALIDNVLDFSKIEAAALELHPAPVSLARLFNESVSMLEPQAATKKLEMRLQLDPRLPEWVMADSTRLRQVLLNLLSNAVKFTREGSVTTKVTIKEIGAEKARFRVEVIDTGVGLSEEQQARLFTRFMQAGQAATDAGGTGLGLAISKELIALMGGLIGVSSDKEQGSNFWFELALPMVEVVASSHGKSPDAPSLTFPGQRVLVVDDVDLNRELMKAMLSRYGLQVITVDNGAEAVAAVAREKFDMVLMDAQMPVMDGFAATRAIRGFGGDFETLPIVALTASGQPEHLEKCMAAGMDDYVRKPVSPAPLEKILKTYIAEPEKPAEAPLATDPISLIDADLMERYRVRKAESLERLEALSRDDLPPDEIEELIQLAHKIAGSAGIFGDPRFGDAAAEAEQALQRARQEGWSEDVRAVIEAWKSAA